MSTAMPGTGWRACSSTTKEFHAARSGRGSAVTMTVSSTSDTTPKRTSGPTTNTRVSTGSPPSTDIVSVCHPGSSRAAMTVSITPPRSATTSCVASPIVDRAPGRTHGHGGEAPPAAHALVLAGPGCAAPAGRSARVRGRAPTPGRRSRGTGSRSGVRPRARARRSRQAWNRYSSRASHSTLGRAGVVVVVRHPLSLSRPPRCSSGPGRHVRIARRPPAGACARPAR